MTSRRSPEGLARARRVAIRHFFERADKTLERAEASARTEHMTEVEDIATDARYAIRRAFKALERIDPKGDRP